LGAVQWPEPTPVDLVGSRCRHPEVEGRALIEVPDLIRLNSMPAAHGRIRQEEVDTRECRAEPAPIGRLDLGVGPIQLAVVATFRMGDQAKGCDQLLGAIDRCRPFSKKM
jgi:hypothetical protein